MIKLFIDADIEPMDLLLLLAKQFDLHVNVLPLSTHTVAAVPDTMRTVSTTTHPIDLSNQDVEEIIHSCENTCATAEVNPGTQHPNEQVFGKVCKQCGNPFSSKWKAARLCDSCNTEKLKKANSSSPAPG